MIEIKGHPLAWLVERVISTPSTHFAHHGLTAEDGISHPNGNYGNLLFLLDVLGQPKSPGNILLNSAHGTG